MDMNSKCETTDIRYIQKTITKEKYGKLTFISTRGTKILRINNKQNRELI